MAATVYKACVLTVSDKGAAGEREDRSGAAIREMLADAGIEVIMSAVVPDEREAIAARLIDWCDNERPALILTTGGTGFSPRDVTPEATMDAVERPAPGVSEAIRAAGMVKTPKAMLSRAAAGIRGATLIVNMPGSEKAVRESLEAILVALPHGLEVLSGASGDCGG